MCNESGKSIGELIHLRLLHISGTGIKKLPKSIIELYNLQTIRIEKCPNIMELPENLSNLINLKHLCFIYSAVNVVPKNVGRFKRCQIIMCGSMKVIGSKNWEI